MLYVIVGILCILTLFVIRHVLKIMRAGKVMKKIENASLKVRVATFARLTKRYEPKYGSQDKVLATVVTNELFSDTSQDDTRAGVFLKNHRDIIGKELCNLTDDKELLRMVHITLSEEILIRHAYGATAEQIEETFDKLKQYGLLVPVEEVKTDKFIDLANQFYRNNISE
ncbi:MAG TPA: hypothetical protein ENH34_07005 [Phycisphaerales bacterium]|nr:hypothetical protein [Phycisphaerales bacterium]